MLFAFSGKDFYSSFQIRKKSGKGLRTICIPCPKLKTIQQRLAHVLTETYKDKAVYSVHGFMPGRSTATNAINHVKKYSVIKLDIKDFFSSIYSGRIKGLFLSHVFCFSEEVANAITNLVCYKGSLPQGAPTSPILSNMICRKMDIELMQFAKINRLKYTRYADDLTFSSTTKRAIKSIISFDQYGEVVVSDQINAIINGNGLKLNFEKTGLFSRGARQVVTGIVVNEKCNFRRDDYRYLRGLF